MARGEVLQKTLNGDLAGLTNTAMAERLRLALSSADEVAFDWDLADDQMFWDGGDEFLRHHVDLESLGTG